MISEERIKQIRKQLHRGEPEGEIKSGLRMDGYTDDEINALFFNLFQKNTPAKAEGKSRQNQAGQPFILAGACFFIAGIAMLSANTWLTKFGAPLIILGVIFVSIKYWLASRNTEE